MRDLDQFAQTWDYDLCNAYPTAMLRLCIHDVDKKYPQNTLMIGRTRLSLPIKVWLKFVLCAMIGCDIHHFRGKTQKEKGLSTC